MSEGSRGEGDGQAHETAVPTRCGATADHPSFHIVHHTGPSFTDRPSLPGVIRSPLAGIARSLFTLLAGDSELSSAARRCYASAILDHPESNSPYSPSLDAQIREFFTSPPHLACIQGAFKVDLIHREEPAAPSTPKSVTPSINSSMTALSGPTSLLDVVFVNFTMHNELNRCAREDEEQHARLAWFALSTLGEQG